MPRRKSVPDTSNVTKLEANESTHEIMDSDNTDKETKQPNISPIISTISDIASMLEQVYTQLSTSLARSNHPEPHQVAKEMITAGYNIALISVEAAIVGEPPTRRVGFNR